MRCRRCGRCCRWEGCVKLTGDEPDRIAAFLGVPVDEFLEKYCRITPDRQALSLIDNPDHSCIFLTGEPGQTSCCIEAVKPAQCRDFPDRWNFPGWRELCPGGAAELSLKKEKHIMKRTGTLIVLSGPSGAGKSTLIGRVKEKLPDLEFSVSCTTRAPRPGEIDHVNYHFISQEEFDARVAADEFVEHACVHAHSYGTLKSEVFRRLEAGHDVLLDIDVQGAMLIRAAAERDERLKRCAVWVFLAPPSLTELERRLRGRGTESEEQIRLRLGAAKQEIASWRKYDYLVINDTVERAAAELEGLFRAFALRTAAQEGDFDDEK